VVTSSFGGNIALRLATRRPEVFRSLSCHEPPLWCLLEGDAESQEMLQKAAASLEAVGRRIAAGDHEGAARQFVEEVAFGPGAWESELPPQTKAIFFGTPRHTWTSSRIRCSSESTRKRSPASRYPCA
jgi:hypothetical protein